MKDHEKRELVNRLTKIASEYAHTQQLRERIAHELLSSSLMTNHPNRGAAPTAAANPSPESILQAREAAGLSQSEAGALIYSGLRSWQHWEWGTRRMHPGLFELFLKKTGQMS